jgi:hypothetical protein
VKAAILFILVIQKRSSGYERIKNKHVTVLLSNQKAQQRYTLILQELLFDKQHYMKLIHTYIYTVKPILEVTCI